MPLVAGDVATVGDANATTQQLGDLEQDVVVAAAVPAVVAMGTAAATCLDEGGDGKQSSRAETPGCRWSTRA